MKRSDNIYLTGLMGSGKSTVGKRLATGLGRDFIDSDREIEEKTGVSIAHIFDVEGEAGFRQREQKAIEELTGRQSIVLATGGGTILAEENRRLLSESGIVIYLRTSIDTILDRTSHDKSRPLLQTEDPRATLEALMQQREPLYLQLADRVVDTDQKSPQDVADEILELLGDTDR